MNVERRKKEKEMLRDYQIDLSLRVRKALSRNRKVLMVSPTGSGKTVLAKDIFERAVNKDITSIFLTDRKEILEQTAKTFLKHGVDFQIVNAETKHIVKHKCYLCMVETFYRRASAKWFLDKNIGLIVCDEAHIGNYWKIIELFPDPYIIGLTATPISSSQTKPLKELYDTIIEGPSVPWLIERGYLVKSIDIGQKTLLELKKQNGEFTSASQNFAFKQHNIDKLMIAAWKQHCKNRQCIVFNIDIEHNNTVCELFKKEGVTCEAVSSETDKDERDRIIEDYRNGKILILCNVGIYTKGFDSPNTSGIIVNRATTSLSLWYQMIGRGGRPFEGKENFILIDMGNNILRHGSYNDEIDWTFLFENDIREKKITRNNPLKLCPLCYAYISNIYIGECPVCGVSFKSRELISIGSLMPPEIAGKKPEEMNLKELYIYAKFKGYKPGWAWVQFANRKNK